MARAKSIRAVVIAGSNGYQVELHDMDDGTAQVVIVGTKTGKRHANVTLQWCDVEELIDQTAALMCIDAMSGEVVIDPKPEYL